MPAVQSTPAKPSYAASIRSKTNKRSTVWEVRFRIANSSTGRSFTSLEAAERFQALVQNAGPAEAIRILENVGANAAVTASGEATPAAQLTLREFAEYHFANQTAASDGTVETYRRFFSNGLSPLADIAVGSITRSEIIAWVKDRGKEVKHKTVKNEHNFLSTLLKRAQSEGAILVNPAYSIPIPKSVGVEMTFLTRDEFAVLLGVIPDRWKHIPLMLAGTGMRWGELTALTPADVDLGRGTLRISRAWKHIGKSKTEPGKWIVGPPKTERGRREVSLTDDLVELFRQHMAGKRRDDLIITAVNGGRLGQQKFYATVWAPARNLANGLPAYKPVEPGKKLKYSRDKELLATEPVTNPIGKWPRVHDLRHSHASWLLEQNINLHTLQYRLGHNSITTTVDRYGHLSPIAQNEARAATDKAMAGLFTKAA